MADPHLDHPGEVSWFPGKGPAEVLGTCPHTGCPHNAGAVVAWGPDLEHYTLDECRVGPEIGGCDGTCRAWAAEVPISEGPAKGRIRYSWSQYMHVDVPPRSAEPAPSLVPIIAPIVATEPEPDLDLLELLKSADLGPEFLEAIRDRRDGYLADLARQGLVLSAEQREGFELGWENAVAAVLAEITVRHWLLVESPLRPEPAGG